MKQSLFLLIASYFLVTACNQITHTNGHAMMQTGVVVLQAPNMSKVEEKTEPQKNNSNVPQDGLNLEIFCGHCNKLVLAPLGYDSTKVDDRNYILSNQFDLGYIPKHVLCSLCNKKCFCSSKQKNNQGQEWDISKIFIKNSSYTIKGSSKYENFEKIMKIKLKCEYKHISMPSYAYRTLGGEKMAWTSLRITVKKLDNKHSY